MKELKALEILKTSYAHIISKSLNKSHTALSLNEAIAELKALQLKNSNLEKLLDETTYSLRCEELRNKAPQDPKTCIGCRYDVNEIGEDASYTCLKCKRYYIFDNYEAKAQQ